MYRSNGSLFHKKSLNTGPIFYKDIPKHESIFSKIFKNGPVFREKCLVQMGTFFCQNDP